MSEFEINGVNYKASKMDAFKQFHVARRLAPVLSGLVPLLSVQPDKQLPDDAPDEAKAAQAAEMGEKSLMALEPLADAMADMPDEHADYILKSCLRVVQREIPEGKGWAPVTEPTTGRLMFTDIDMGVMLRIVVKVVEDNLAGFFAALPKGKPSK